MKKFMDRRTDNGRRTKPNLGELKMRATPKIVIQSKCLSTHFILNILYELDRTKIITCR